MRSAIGKAVLAIGIVTLLAGGARLYGLSAPEEKVFDEVYYASDACWYAGIDHPACGLEQDAERSWVHPPLGKMAIALGIDAYGNRSFGWRIGAAVAGTATVALVGTLAFLLFRSWVWGGVGALLAAVESLGFVQSRIAMLDVFLTLFVVLGFVLLVGDRRRVDRRIEAAAGENDGTRSAPAAEVGWFRPLRLGAGAALGAATAVKWSGVLALVAAIVLSVAWERSRHRVSGARRPLATALRRDGLGLYAALVVVPAVVYTATWLPWLADRGFDLVEWLRHHGHMAGYHVGLDPVKESGEPIHPYMSRAWTWLLLTRPVAYFWEGDPSCCRYILGVGHPLVFWGALVTLPYLAFVWVRRRDWRAGAILVPALFQFLPWLVVPRPLFLFYMTPVAPFLALAATFALRDVAGARPPYRRIGVPLAFALVVAAVAVFVFLWPVLVGERISMDAWRARMWLDGWV